jgi:hypothetical protein
MVSARGDAGACTGGAFVTLSVSDDPAICRRSVSVPHAVNNTAEAISQPRIIDSNFVYVSERQYKKSGMRSYGQVHEKTGGRSRPFLCCR